MSFSCNVARHTTGAANLHQVSKQPKTSYIGQGMHARLSCELLAGAIELRRNRQHLCVFLWINQSFLERRTKHTDAQRLGQHQHVTRAGIAISLDGIWMDQTQHRESVDRLGSVDRVAAADLETGVTRHTRAA